MSDEISIWTCWIFSRMKLAAKLFSKQARVIPRRKVFGPEFSDFGRNHSRRTEYCDKSSGACPVLIRILFSAMYKNTQKKSIIYLFGLHQFLFMYFYFPKVWVSVFGLSEFWFCSTLLRNCIVFSFLRKIATNYQFFGAYALCLSEWNHATIEKSSSRNLGGIITIYGDNAFK